MTWFIILDVWAVLLCNTIKEPQKDPKHATRVHTEWSPVSRRTRSLATDGTPRKEL